MENRFYVYIHSKKDGSCVYVGKGCNSRAWKFAERSKRWTKAFSDEKPDVTIVAKDLSEDDAFRLEMDTIIALRQENIIVLNVELDTRGDSRHWTPEMRANWSVKMSGPNHPLYGKKRDPELMKRLVVAAHTPEALAKSVATHRENGSYEWTDERKQQVSEKMTGYDFGPEHAAKISAAKKGIPSGRNGEKFSEEHKRNISEATMGRVYGKEVQDKRIATWKANGMTTSKAKQVRCIDTGEVFRSSKEAAESLTGGIGMKVIQQCCIGTKKRYKGLSFEHVSK